MSLERGGASTGGLNDRDMDDAGVGVLTRPQFVLASWFVAAGTRDDGSDALGTRAASIDGDVVACGAGVYRRVDPANV
jgi:hypothetical protein